MSVAEVSYDGCSRGCPTCRGPAEFQRWQGRVVVTLLGTVRLTRPYDHCPAGCGGHSPRDAALRLSADRFTAATKTLPELCGLRPGESTVERATERAGAEVGRRLAAGETFGPSKAWDWSEDSGRGRWRRRASRW